MSFAVNVLDPAIEKHILVTIRPRKYLDSWTNEGGGVYSAEFSGYPVTRVWTTSIETQLTKVDDLASVSSGKFFHDFENGVLYVGAASLPDYRIAEFQVSIADQFFTGPMDPLDGDSQVVDWIPAISNAPALQDGDRTSLFGFQPLGQASLIINNADGWLNNLLHEISFTKAPVRAYVMADSDYDRAISESNIQKVLSCYASERLTGDIRRVNLAIGNFWQFLDQSITPAYKFTSTDFDPGTFIRDPYNGGTAGLEWYVRMVRGMVDAHVPVNVDYFVTPGTTVNRDWVTHEDDRRNNDVGTVTHTEDHAASNTTTKTFFTTTPQFNVGDWVIFHRNGTDYPREVLTVDRANKWVTHSAIADTVMSGNTATRWYVASVSINIPNGSRLSLQPGRDYTLFGPGTPDVLGFTLADNFEANFPGASEFNGNPFDPGEHEMVCRVYGPKALQQYTDASSVGEVKNDGGIDASAVSMLYWLLLLAGIDADDIDETSFKAVANGGHALGRAIPRVASNLTPETYKEVITEILNSMLWKLCLVRSGSDLKIGLVELAPMGTSDYSATEDEHSVDGHEIDWSDIYYSFSGEYRIRENPLTGVDAFPTYVNASNERAKALHLTSKAYEIQMLQYMEDDAQEAIDRLSYVLGERRAYYTVSLGQEFINKADIGASYDLIRQFMPGFALVQGTERTRQLSVIEVEKNNNGVKLVLEDQQGIQDHEGDW